LIALIVSPVLVVALALGIRWWQTPPAVRSSLQGEGGVPDDAGTAVPTIAVLKIGSALGAPDPAASFWADAVRMDVMMMPQNMTMPMVDTPGAEVLAVAAATDGVDLAWRIEWADATQDATPDVDRFGDAVAIQFPLTEAASPMMGLGGKVHILHWKAIWQTDIEQGFQDDGVTHPNTFHALAWFATSDDLATGYTDERSRVWLTHHSAGNPMSNFSREQPVEETFAAGFGTLTSRSLSLTKARGRWADGRWSVVIQRPLAPADDPEGFRLAAGGKSMVSFAVWGGSLGHVGGRKMWANWVPFEVPR